MTRRDFRDVYAGLKDFQLATVDHVASRFYEDDEPTDRFLVADEVGLGKTLVARGVIARTIEHHLERDTRRIDVVYICSNGDIARQNINKLNVLERKDIQLASRITLLPRILHELENNRINFVSFTPGTSFNLRSSQGVVNERVLLFHLLAEHWPDLMRGAGARKALAGGASFKNFTGYLGRMTRDDLDDSMAAGFRSALDLADANLVRQEQPTHREQMEELTDRLRWVRRNSSDAIDSETMRLRAEVVGDLREILAQVCVEALEPDLVILDEFQRFKQVFREDSAEGQLATRLFNYREADQRVKVLLLSATPYKMYTLTEEAEEDHYADFVDTLRFLLPEREVAELADDLRAYRQALWRIGEDRGLEARRIRHRIEHRLRSVMCRTERLAVKANRDGMLTEQPAAGVELHPEDVRRYLALEEVGDEVAEGYGMLPFWMSAAYPLNFMEGYKLDRKFDAFVDAGGSRRLRSLLGTNGLLLPWDALESYRQVDPGNARLRGLLGDTVDRGMWRLLWLRPSLPYYELGEPFDDPHLEKVTKRLVFSSWTVVPKVVAAMTTYEAERHMMRSFSPDVVNTPEARDRITELLRFQRSQGRLSGMPVLALLYPCRVLAEVGDPLTLATQLGGVDQPIPQHVLRQHVADRVRALVEPLLEDTTSEGAADARWYWAAPFLLDHRVEGDGLLAWLDDPEYLASSGGAGDDERHDETVSRGLVEHYEEVQRLLADELEPLGRPPQDLVDVLTELAIGGLGVVALRALQRLGIQRVDDEEADDRDYALDITYGFRSLFNEPEVQYLLRGAAGRGQREDSYWRLVLRYCVDGCLQAVMDEYLHMLVESLGVIDLKGSQRFGPLVTQIHEVLTMRTTTYGVRRIDVDTNGVHNGGARMRGNFAVRFGTDKSEDEASLARSSTVRKAFNSPFRPFVLATTSVGQEGLDFHTYCHAVVHWNLPGNPVDMEQREGRVHRYKGHAVRKNAALWNRAAAFTVGRDDPWTAVFEAAGSGRAAGDNELVPYWVYPVDGGTTIERYVPALPLSRDARQLEHLRRSMAAYRLVFGQPRQEDLVAFLSERIAAEDLESVLGDLRIDLTPEPLSDGRREYLITVPRVQLPAPQPAANAAPKRSASVSRRRALYRRFWDRMLADIKRRYPGWTRANASTDSWVPLPAGTSGIFYTMVFGRGRLRIELYVDPANTDLLEFAWDELVAQKSEIEQRFGAHLTWEELPTRRASRIAWYYDRDDVDIADESRWDEYRDWIIRHLGHFRDSLQPSVDGLAGRRE